MKTIQRLLKKNILEQKYKNISYSQSGEDLIVNFLSSKLFPQKTGVFIDIGANHPVRFNNTYLFYLKGWRGYNVDPLLEHIELFDVIRPEDNNLCYAVGSNTELCDFYRFDADTLSTIDKESARLYTEMGHKLIKKEKIQTITVADLFNRHSIPNKIDIFSLDIEGGEEEILQDLATNNIHTKVLILETLEYSKKPINEKKQFELINRVCGLGYDVYADTLINTIFVSNDLRNLI